MKKALLLATSLFLSSAQAITGNEALHNLTEKTRTLRNINRANNLYWFAAVPLIFLGSSCTEKPFETGVGITIGALAGQASISIAEWVKGVDARWYFRYLYNKKVDAFGNLVDGFSEGKFVLNDQMFIALGLKAGFYEYELIDLAKKAGRMALAQQLAATEYYA